jgi:hypothetical protein
MNESTFRSLFRSAIGEPEVPIHLSSQSRLALQQSVDRQTPRLREALALVAALVAAVAVVATLLGPRVFTHDQQPAGTSSPSPVATSPSPDPNACRLPIVVDDETTSVLKETAGFINVASGQFSADTNVSFADLPHDATLPNNPPFAVYDPVVKRWLPSEPVSPDQLSYAYVIVKAGSSQLHTYDLVQHKDRTVWTYRATISPTRWKGDGIYASTVPFAGGEQGLWRIDPLSGRATKIDQATFDPYQFQAPSWGTSGLDPERKLYTIGSREKGTRYTVFVIINGKRTDIYSGVNGDKMDFQPDSVSYDGPRLWFSNNDSKYLWSWTAATGLTRHTVHIPNSPGTATKAVVYYVKGPCV